MAAGLSHKMHKGHRRGQSSRCDRLSNQSSAFLMPPAQVFDLRLLPLFRLVPLVANLFRLNSFP